MPLFIECCNCWSLVFEHCPCFVLQEKAVKWYSDDSVDGLTTNGVFLMQLQGGFSHAGKPGSWREVSVGGSLFSLRDSRPSPLKSHQVRKFKII